MNEDQEARLITIENNIKELTSRFNSMVSEVGLEETTAYILIAAAVAGILLKLDRGD